MDIWTEHYNNIKLNYFTHGVKVFIKKISSITTIEQFKSYLESLLNKLIEQIQEIQVK